MSRRWTLVKIALACFIPFSAMRSPTTAQEPVDRPPAFRIHLDQGHPWRPPFGLERIGRLFQVVVEARERPEPASYFITAVSKGVKGASYPLGFPVEPPYSARVTLERDADEVLLSRDRKPPEKPIELARQVIRFPEFEAEAIARPDVIINPVDLGTILVPQGWLLLGPGQSAKLEAAAISRTQSWPRAQLTARFESSKDAASAVSLPLEQGARATAVLPVPPAPAGRDRDVLSIAIENGDGKELWRKRIPVMLVAEPLRHPRFGVTFEKLRFDAPISVRDPATGKYSSLRYQDGWKPELDDVVVWLPNGSRFVFWRGSSYIPFWAGQYNTGACYEWAEIISQPKGAVDCVEPLMDKELRYGRVEVVEATAAQIHLRWTYQSTDFEYKVWGDQAVEDYYFYPDGFGTRVLSLKADPKNEYELSEFIILTPEGAYPFDILPEHAVDALFLDGRKHEFRLPNPAASLPSVKEADRPGSPAIYRLRLSKYDEPAAVYFNPGEKRLPPVVFGPFFDARQMVTPCYWGSHWPLARGNSTGNKIDDRIAFTPCHNSIMSWAGCRPEPIRSAMVETLDSLGRSRLMSVRRWAWLIGMTDESDAELLERAKSFAAPPDLDLLGARPALDGYAIERRAICLVATARDIKITVKPKTPVVNPVFELAHAPRGQITVSFGGETLHPRDFAWDGRSLWLDRTINAPTTVEIRLAAPLPYLR
jgi:hypothetical protein